MDCVDLKSNEWHIAIMQIYENLFVRDANARNEMGELVFNSDGTLMVKQISHGRQRNKQQDTKLNMSAALRPLLGFIDGHRRRVAAPEHTGLQHE